MTKHRLAVTIIPLLAIIVFGAGCYSTSTAGTNNTNTATPTPSTIVTPTTTNSGSTNTSTAPLTAAVSLQNFSFSPATLTIKKGGTVTWTNNDSTNHTVTGTNGGPDGKVSPGASYSFAFTTVGTFSYHCSIHPTMTGTVTVVE